jgi:exosortase
VNVALSRLESTRDVLKATSAAAFATALAFLLLFGQPLLTMMRDWTTDPESAHGLLLAPIAVFYAWKQGLLPERRAQPLLGLTLLVSAVFLRVVSSLAAELFTMRMSMLLAAAALIIFSYGTRQLVHWWLSSVLLLLSVPIPPVLLGSIALPLQFLASQMGAAMLDARYVPVHLAGNVIQVPGKILFVTEACSGLRSLTALLALGVLIAGVTLRSPWLRIFLIASTIPVAIVLNAVRIFLTGYLVYFVSPEHADSFLHYSEGWLLFLVAFGALGALALVLGAADRRLRPA